MLHIAAGVFLGLVFFKALVDWEANEPQRRLDRRINREWRQSMRAKRERERQRQLQQEAERKMQEAQRAAYRTEMDLGGTIRAICLGVAAIGLPWGFVIALGYWLHSLPHP